MHSCYVACYFNPISFYHIHNNDVDIEVTLAEVSKSPWSEMKCHALYPHSIDVIQVKRNNIESSLSSVNCMFSAPQNNNNNKKYLQHHQPIYHINYYDYHAIVYFLAKGTKSVRVGTIPICHMLCQ